MVIWRKCQYVDDIICLETLSHLCSIFSILSSISSSSLPLILQPVNFHFHFGIHRLWCSKPPSLRSSSFLPSPPPIPHYPPPRRKAVRVLGIRWAVKSHKLLLLCVWPSNRGGRAKERETEEERARDFMLQHFWTWICPLPHCPFPPLFTQTRTSTRTAARPHIYPLQSKYLPPAHNSQLSHPPPPSPPDLSPCHPYGKDTSTTLLQCAGHYTQQLDESLQPSRGIKPLLSLWRTASVTSTKKSKAPHTTHTMPPGTPCETWQILSKGHKHVVTVFTTLMICVFSILSFLLTSQ